jgi:GntR family transcriptional repressor for pyruvate dehydrogenase complex
MLLKPVRKVSVADSIFRQLRESILSGQLAPGDELPGERTLSEQLEANRGAIREALKRLEQARLVEIRHGEATRVLDFRSAATLDIMPQLLRPAGQEIDLKVARSMIELRKVITPDMTRLAVARGRPELPAVLRAILQEMRASDLSDQILQELTDEFWMIIANNSGNIAYRLILNTVTEVRKESQKFLAGTISTQYRDLSHLERITIAIERGDVEDAFNAATQRSEMMASAITSNAPTPK